MSVLQDLAQVARQIIIRHPYYGMFLSTLNRTVDNKQPTAGVSKNGLNTQLSINEEFWDKLTSPQKTGVLIHELLHICLFHITMRKSFSDWKLFNVAADVEINQYILDLDKVELPKGCITLESLDFDPKTEAKKGTRYYYEKMRKQLESGGGSQTLKDLMKDMNEGQEVVCSHGTWKDFDKLNNSEKRIIEDQIARQMKHSWENIDKSRSNLPSQLKGILDELLKPRKSVFNWKAAIRRFTGGYSQETYTKKLRRKHNKRFPDYPGLKIKHRKNLLCAVDTSGSVSKEEFIEFMKEIDVIRKTGVQVTVCECDAYVDKKKGVYKFTGLKSISGRRITGGGGKFVPPYAEMYSYSS